MSDVGGPVETGGYQIERAMRPNLAYESFGVSDRGGRPAGPDEDSFFTPSQGFNFGEIGGDKDTEVPLPKRINRLANAIHGLAVPDSITHSPEILNDSPADIANVHNTIKELISPTTANTAPKLRGLDIICDGAGGQGEGEVASSIVTYIIAREIAAAGKRTGPITEADLRHAVFRANVTLRAYNQRRRERDPSLDPKSDPLTTLVVQMTDATGVTYVASCGDSRAYLLKSSGEVELKTHDQSYVNYLVGRGHLHPSDIYTHELRGMLIMAFGNEGFRPEDVPITKYDLRSGDQLVLCCDGVWEDIHPQDGITKGVLDDANKEFDKVLRKGKSFAEAAQAAQAYVFKHVNLAGLELNGDMLALANFLVKRKGMLSHDNVSAIVVKNTQAPDTTPVLTNEPLPRIVSAGLATPLQLLRRMVRK